MGRVSASCVLAVALIAVTVGAATRPSEVEAGSPRVSTCIFDHNMLRTSGGVCRPRARLYPRKVRTAVERSIYDGALTFGIPYSVMLKVARCESRLDPRADDGVHVGLYQFLPSTFASGARKLRRSTGIAAGSYWNPLDATYVAGFLFATGQSQQWSCA